MAVTSKASTVWTGSLTGGSGTTTLDSSKSASFPVTWAARSEGSASTTTPEELLGAAHASCFSMAFAHALTGAGHEPERIETSAAVTFEPGTGVTGSHLTVSATVPGIDREEFDRIADEAKTNCPVSAALAGVPISLEATLS